ncbi:MAG: nitroreductase [Candidatus Omnitrophota bacterium]
MQFLIDIGGTLWKNSLMDNLTEIIKGRRSIRKFLDKPIPKEAVDQLIEAAKWAPSGMNHQPWGFIVVQDKTLIKELSDHSIPHIKKLIETNPKLRRYKRRMAVDNFSIFYHAACVIIIVGKIDSFSCDQDCAMAAQNLMLKAYSLDIGSCWIGMMSVLDKDEWFRQRFDLPDTYKIIAPIALGYFEDKDIPIIERVEPGVLKYF